MTQKMTDLAESVEKALIAVTDSLANALDTIQGTKDRLEILTDEVNTAATSPDFVLLLTVFVLACFVGYYVVWKVTPALHSPLMAVTNAISSVIIVGALIAAAPAAFSVGKVLGFLAVLYASVNIFGGFIVTERMLAMFKPKAKKETK